MHVTPTDLESLVKVVQQPNANTRFQGYAKAALRICEGLEPNMVIDSDDDRIKWLIGVETVHSWAVADPDAKNPFAGGKRPEKMTELLEIANRWWRGPSTGPARALAFIKDKALRAIAERDLQSLNATSMAEETKSVLILGGSVIEAVLLDILERDPGLTTAAAAKQPKPASFKSQPNDWDFFQMVDVCGPTGLSATSAATTDLAHKVRWWRNFVHPDRERKELARNPLRRSDGMVVRALTDKVLEEAADWCAKHP
jgi:hypothetical protein